METSSGAIKLKAGREKPVNNRHPWIFSGAVQQLQGSPQPGDLVDVIARDGTWLALAYFNPHSQIRARILSWNSQVEINEDWWAERLRNAIAYRDYIEVSSVTDAYRLVNAEADRLPGLVVDRYGDYLVLQALTYGIDRRKELVARLLVEALQPAGVVERSDVDVRKKEGLAEARGMLNGPAPPDNLTIIENGLAFATDLLQGHKTGLYLDQRDNRLLFGQPRFCRASSVLNVFSYTGGFALQAIAAGAESVTNVDSSTDVLELARRNVERNFGSREQDQYVSGDAFQILREYRDTNRRFDAVVLDPPKFAYSQRDVENAARGYKDLNWLAFRLLRPGGILATFSCSGLVSADLFQKIVFSAVRDAGCDAQILYQLTQAPDHPVLLTFPESAYLKGLLLRVV